ncbi:MAG: hypothetical protein DRJ39_05035 [Thermoprotei archaeon]|nr:MAG: hypothetical protein DRJ39_05035 [Thermoprotei archaeon]
MVIVYSYNKLLDFLNEVKAIADARNYTVKKGFIVQNIGFSQETAYRMLAIFERLGLLVIENNKLRLTSEGRKFVENVLDVVSQIKNEFPTYRYYDYGRVLGRILYALTDWQNEFETADECLTSLERLKNMIKKLSKASHENYRYYLSLLLWYDFENFDDPYALLHKVAKLKL